MKTAFFFFLAILSQVAVAGDWTHLNLANQGYSLRVSYTKTYLPATYGSTGGPVGARSFLDLTTASASHAEKVEVYELKKNGQVLLTQSVRLTEDHSRHFWAQILNGDTYGDYLYVGSTYLLRLTVDGRIVDFTFKAI